MRSGLNYCANWCPRQPSWLCSSTRRTISSRCCRRLLNRLVPLAQQRYAEHRYGYSSEFIEYVKAMPVERGRGTATGRALLERQVVHIADVLADPDYTWAEAQRLDGYRTVLAVPMLREGVPTGVLTLTRSEVRPFTEKQIELV